MPHGMAMMEIKGDDSPDCRQALEAMYAFLDRECTPDVRIHVQQHLDECLPCLEAFEFETELKQVIANKCQEQMPVHLLETIRTQLRIEVTRTAPLPTSSQIPENPPADGIPSD